MQSVKNFAGSSDKAKEISNKKWIQNALKSLQKKQAPYHPSRKVQGTFDIYKKMDIPNNPIGARGGGTVMAPPFGPVIRC